MAQIKSYTSLEQSKALAKILPHESADMSWATDNDVIVVPHNIVIRKNKENILKDATPCWSLAALLDVIPCGQVNKMADSNKFKK